MYRSPKLQELFAFETPATPAQKLGGEMPITVTTPKLTPRQLRLRRPESTHYRVSFGSVFSPT